MMEGLKNGTVTVQTANASAGLSQVLINSLKVEVEARRAAGDKTLAGFVSEQPALPELTAQAVREEPVADDYVQGNPKLSSDEEWLDSLLPRYIPGAPPIGARVTTHRMKDDE